MNNRGHAGADADDRADAGRRDVVLREWSAANAQTLRIGLAEDPDLLDPTLARTYVGRIVFASLCDKLVDISPELDIVPQLATSWNWVDDNKGLVFHLRQGVKFQDGTPFDAAAVKVQHRAQPRTARLEPQGRNQRGDRRRGDRRPHGQAGAVAAFGAPLLAALTDRAGMIVSPTAAEKEGVNFSAHPVCAGPFKFAERVAQDRIVLDRFADYWNKDQIHFEKIVFLPIADSTVRLANLQSGALDLIERVAATDLDTVKHDSRLALAMITSLAYQGITINLNNGDRAKNPLGQDKRVREALELSIDRAALNQVVFNGEFQPGNQWDPPGNRYYIKDYPIPGRDVAKAKAAKLLAAAGVPRPSFEMMVPTHPEIERAAQVIQAMAAEAGFDIKIRATEFTSALDHSVSGDYQAFLVGWSGRTDPDGNIYNFSSCKGPKALNVTHYCNKDVDAALDAARLTSDPAARTAQYKIVADHVLKDRPVIYLWHPKWLLRRDH